MVAKVIVDIAHANVDRVFDYAVPAALTDAVVPGARVSVPFRAQKLEGYVMALTEDSQVPENRLKSIHAVLDDLPALLPALIDLAVWIKEQYHGCLVDALRLMLPAEMRGQRIAPKMVRMAHLMLSGEEAKAMAGKTHSKKQAAVLTVLADAGDMDVADLYAATGTDSAVLLRLRELGAISILEREEGRRPYAAMDKYIDGCPTPTKDQQAAIDEIVAALDDGSGAFLLYGVTGSGKTEVYMQCAQYALDSGGDVLILVPEIALTPQMVSRFTARFGSQAAVLHSRLSVGERFDEWRRIRSGEARVVIGARSAIFAPVSRLALVVIDEEHENSYKSEHTPRYDAVEVARRRCAAEGGVLVMGSATPSVERFYATEQGEFTLLRLSSRISDQPMPEVDIVDMREELARGNRSVLSGKLVEAMRSCLERGEQSILFINRRGHSNFVSCRACGYVCRCDLCDISLTYHQHDQRLRCHYCGETRDVPNLCPACGSPYIRYFGGGTQKVEEAVQALFPKARMLRMDADTTSGKDAHQTMLDAFRRQEVDILIGTQMIAKGLDFPMVTLVGIIAADLSLHVPDYRNAERTFQLVAQVAGRAGRAEREGRVVLQTYSPDHFSIQMAAGHDYLGFYEREIVRRRLGEYPPYGRFMRMVFTNEHKKSADEDAAMAHDILNQWLRVHPESELSVLLVEVGNAPVERIQARYRTQLLVKAKPDHHADAVERALADIAVMTLPGGSLVALEINPVSMI